MGDLEKLIEAVEAGEASTMRFEDCGFDGWAELAYHGSLDAAKVLHEALLPEWTWEVSFWPGGLSKVCLLGTHNDDGERWHNHRDGEVKAAADNPARAWLLAILRALAKREEG